MKVSHIALVGLGSIGRRHVRILKELRPEFAITLVRSGKGLTWPEQQLAQRVVKTSAEAIRSGAQAAIVCSPAPFHVSQAMEWIKEGRPVLIEKPLSHDTVGLSELAALAEARKVPVLVGYVLRYDVAAQYFYEWLKSDEIGELLYVRVECGSFLPNWRPEQDYRESASARKDLGGGVLLELSHELDYVNWFFGPINDVQASLQNSDTLEVDTEDGAELLLHNTNGLPVSLHLDFYRRVPIRQCRVQTTKGELSWDCLAQLVRWTDDKGQFTEKIFQQERDDLFRCQLEHFFDCLEKHAVPKVTLNDGIDVMQMIEKARYSDCQHRIKR